MVFTDGVYNVFKWLAQYLFPAIATLYFALARIWNLPYAEEVVGTITAVDAFLGVLLGISSSFYEGDGEVSLTKIADQEDADYDANTTLFIDPEELAKKKTLVLKVVD